MTTPMPISAADLQPLLPELTLIAGAFGLLMLDLFLDNARRFITHALALVVMVAVVWMLPRAWAGRAACSAACSCATRWPMSARW